jgi:Tfp pilus assembly protein PilO
VNLSARDRKLALFIGPAVLFAAYWFLALAPKREEASSAQLQVATAEQKRDDLSGQVANQASARRDFGSDYQTVVRLGKAVPTNVDMPSLIVQLDKASAGSGIRFERIKAGERLSATVTPGAAPPPAAAPAGEAANGAPPAAAPGGEKAATSGGQAAEKAGEAKQTSEAGSGAAPDATPGAADTAGASAAAAPGLDAVPLEFTFRGSFFELADLLHRLKRFVRLADTRLSVKGRLMTVAGFSFKQTETGAIEAQVQATAYLAPKAEGATAGATPSGPATPGATPAAGTGAPPSPSPSAAAPAAVATR